MLSSITTKIALKRAGIPTNSNFSMPKIPDYEPPAFKNPLANAKSPIPAAWQTPAPPAVEKGKVPEPGERAPQDVKRRLRVDGGMPVMVSFLRCCGCPFAEKDFVELRRLANKYPALRFVAISHSSAAATQKWVDGVGGAWDIEIIIDESRELYALWGLGVSNTWYVLNPWTQWGQWQLGKKEGVWAKDVGEGGNKWVQKGTWAVDSRGIVRWGGIAASADAVMDVEEGCRILGF